jgi:serine/threonine protein kinase
MDSYLNYFNETSDDEYIEQIGGNILDEGGYGCVYYPSINCRTGKENKNKKHITKIQIENSVSNNEYKIGEIIKKIRNYKKMFVPVIQKCPIKINKLDDKIIDECNILTNLKIKDKNRKRNLVMMKTRYIENKIFLHYFNDLQPHKKLIKYVEFYKYLLNSLDKLQENNLVHYDLKGNNILVDLKNEIPLIIDFGLTININKITKENIQTKLIYAYDYALYSPELNYIAYLYTKNKNPSKNDIIQISENIFSTIDNKILNYYYSKNFRDNYKKLLTDTLLKYREQSVDEIYKEFTKKMWKKCDIYSLGIMYMRLFKTIFKNYNHPFIIFFNKILLNNIHPNPYMRISTKEIIEKIDNYFIVNKDINYRTLLDLVY